MDDAKLSATLVAAGGAFHLAGALANYFVFLPDVLETLREQAGGLPPEIGQRVFVLASEPLKFVCLAFTLLGVLASLAIFASALLIKSGRRAGKALAVAAMALGSVFTAFGFLIGPALVCAGVTHKP